MHGSLVTSSLKLLVWNHKTMDTNSAKKKRRITLLRLMGTLGDLSIGMPLLIIVVAYIFSLLLGPSFAYGLPLWESPLWLLISTALTLTSQSSMPVEEQYLPGLMS